jgi:sortase A
VSRDDFAAPARPWFWIECLAWTVGLSALALSAVLVMSGAVETRRGLHRFRALQSSAAALSSSPDQSLWSPERVRAWQEAQKQDGPVPLAVLRIPRFGLEVPVLEGTDEWTLNRAVGHIEDTAVPGAEGNSGIAGHRDGFFRILKDISTGDLLDIETLVSVTHYRVERTWVVDPDDVSVLDPTDAPAVTLVTCYPFYFVGSAPQRFIVRAIRTGTTAKAKTLP